MRSASMRNVMWVAWATASSSPPPSGGLRDAQVRNNSALPKLDNRSRSAGSAMTRTALSWLIAWVLALTAESLAILNIRALCTGPSPVLARARARPLSTARAAA